MFFFLGRSLSRDIDALMLHQTINQIPLSLLTTCRKGLTGAGVPLLHGLQKQHRAINQTVMMAIDVLMNPAAPVAGVAEA